MSRPVGWLRQRTCGLRSASSTRRGHLAPRHPLAAVDARLHPVELGEDVVGQVEPPVGEDVALDPAQDAERREPLVGRRDLLGLPADVVGAEAAHGADRRRVVADREVLVAALAARRAPSPRRSPGRPTRSCGSAGRRGCRPARRAPAARRANGSSRSSGGHQGMPERAVDRRLVGRRRAAARARRRTPARPSRARSAVPKRAGSATTSSTGTPSTVTPTRAALALLDHRDDLRQRGEARQHAARGPAPRTRPRAARTSRASAARRRPPRRPRAVAIDPDELPRAASSSPRGGSRLGFARERLEQPRLGLGPDRPARPAAGRPPPPREAPRRRADAERPRDLHRALRAQPEIAAETDQPGRQLALELRQLGDVARLHELAQPRLDPRADAAQLAHPTRPHELGDGTGAPRIVSAARRYARAA